MSAGSSFVVLGRILKPHGVKGQVRVEFYGESPELLKKPLMIRAGRFAPRPVRVRDWQLWQDQLILSIEGCHDRSEAERLRGQELLVDAAFLPETGEDEPYIRDLLGLRVFLQDGTYLGLLEDISFPAGQEIWAIRTPDAEGGREILFPAVPQFVLDIDLDAGTVGINPPEGLIELYCGNTSEMPDDGQSEAATGLRPQRR